MTTLQQDAQRKLKDAISALEALDDQINDIKIEVASKLKELKGEGFDVKAIRKILSRRRKRREVVEQEDQMLELYEGVLQ